MLKAIRQALSQDGKFPLTLIVLDEVQQYIGEDSQRSMDVQEAVEACCKNIGGKLLFIGTGQTCSHRHQQSEKLEGRFTIRVELSDADVDAVIRQVILAKKPEAKAPIEQMMQTNLGEISRHLAGTSIGHRQDDMPYFSQDYPNLAGAPALLGKHPARARPDRHGQPTPQPAQHDPQGDPDEPDAPLGHVVPADYLYFDSADKLLQSRLLPRKVHEKTMRWNRLGG